MTSCSYQEHRPLPVRPLARLVTMFRTIGARRAARRSAAPLRRMSDHELRDIGLTPAEAAWILRHPDERPDLYRGR